MAPKQINQRSGWASTKLHLSLIVMVLVTGVYAMLGFPESQFALYCGTLLSAATIFAGTRTVESVMHRNTPDSK